MLATLSEIDTLIWWNQRINKYGQFNDRFVLDNMQALDEVKHILHRLLLNEFNITRDLYRLAGGCLITWLDPAGEIPNVVGSNRRFSWLAMDYKL